MGTIDFPQLLLAAQAVIILAATIRAYMATRDPFHPLVFLSPMLFYVFVFRPLVLMSTGAVEPVFNIEKLTLVMIIKTLSLGAFCLGGLTNLGKAQRLLRSGQVPVSQLSPLGQQWAFAAACLLGGMAVLAFGIALRQSGGFLASFSYAYGGAYANSGYLADLPMWSCSAVLLVALSRQGRPLRFQDAALCLFFCGPMLASAFLSARRGAAFFALVTLWSGWYLWQRRRPSLQSTLGWITGLGLLALVLVTYRKEIYIGSKFNVDSRDFVEGVFNPRQTGAGDDFIDSSGLILVSEKYGRHNWGARMLVNYFVRPIPRQLWPNKYADCGMGWLEAKIERWGYTDTEWQNAAGFVPIVGMATGFDGGFFLDFRWGGLAACYLAGLLFSVLWLKERQKKGVWQPLLAIALVVSIHLVAQDFTAAFYRWLFIALPLVFLWRVVIARYGVTMGWQRPRLRAREFA